MSRSKKISKQPQPKVGHDPLLNAEVVPLKILRPAELNDAVYKPVDPNDPDVRALGESVRNHGLKVPIAITLDNVISVTRGRCRTVETHVAGADRGAEINPHAVRIDRENAFETLLSALPDPFSGHFSPSSENQYARHAY